MKYVFIINPISGDRNNESDIRGLIENSKYKDKIEVYVTKSAGDATRFVREYCSNNDEEVRFVSCGGDGTMNEVANGAMYALSDGFDADRLSITCFPCGSGNDLVKTFGGADKFLNLDALIEAKNCRIDMLRVEDKYSINIVNFGFDAYVIKVLDKLRAKYGHGGKSFYLRGVIKALFNGMHTKCKLYVDDKLVNPEGEALLCTLANGQYVGGSFRCAPRAKMDDGLIDVCLVKCVSRLKFIQCVGSYSKGTHLENPHLKSSIYYLQGKKVRVESEEGFSFTLDGELIFKDSFELEIIDGALNFAVPA